MASWKRSETVKVCVLQLQVLVFNDTGDWCTVSANRFTGVQCRATRSLQEPAADAFRSQ